MNNAVKYRDMLLAKNSEAYTLWENYKKDPKAQKILDAHLKVVSQQAVDLQNRYVSK